MIVALRGDLVRWDAERSALWIDAGGVTYEVHMSAFSADWVASHAEGEEVQVFHLPPRHRAAADAHALRLPPPR